jgi:drug/metabolite transporter (DMT)-like permease
MSVLLAALAALLYGAAVAVQHHEAAAVDPASALRPRLLLDLLRRPLWLIGLLGDIGGFALQTAALALGSLVVVQPILTSSLVVSLVLEARLGHRRLHRTEWTALGGILVGLTVFLVVARPTAHSDAIAAPSRWLVALGVTMGVVAVALVAGRAVTGTGRGLCFAVAAACSEAVMAVLAKAFGDRLGKGVWSSFLSWQPYAVAACGIVILVLVQSAYQVDEATATLPVLTVTEPLVAIGLGAVLFHERVDLSGPRAPVVAVSILAMLVGLVMISRGGDRRPRTASAAGR